MQVQGVPRNMPVGEKFKLFDTKETNNIFYMTVV